MLAVIIQDAQGREVSKLKASGESLSILPGQRIVCQIDTDALTSLVREGDELRFFLNNAIMVRVPSFFAVAHEGLQFSDQHFSIDDIQARLNLHVIVNTIDNETRDLFTQHGSRIYVNDGDRFEFLNTEVRPEDLHRHGSDLRVVYHLDKDQLVHLDLIGFFDVKVDQTKPPVVVLADSEHRTTDLFVQPQQQNFRMTAMPMTIATAGVMYAFYFIIHNFDQTRSEVEVLLDGKKLPDWLSLNHMGSGKFILSGIPPLDYQGTKKVEINVTNKEEGVNVRTQESYQLVISARPELTERAAVVGVLVAETRGAVATHSSESFLAGSQSAAAAGAAPLALIAALSSLTVFSTVRGARLEGGAFDSTSAEQFLKDALELDVTGLKLGVGSLDLSSSTGYGLMTDESAQAGGNRSFKERDERERERERDEETVAQGDTELSIDEMIASYDASAANLSGGLVAVADVIDVMEDSAVTIKRPGVLSNDINQQTPFTLISQVSYLDPNLPPGANTVMYALHPTETMVDFMLPSGALVEINRRGELTYDPNGSWEFLAQDQSAPNPDVVNYSITNGLEFLFGANAIASGGTITFNVIGENDPTSINNQTFTVNENTPNASLVGLVIGTDIDYLDIPQLTLVEVSGDTDVFEVSLTGAYNMLAQQSEFNLTVQDVLRLNYEDIFNNPFYSFTVEIEDPYGLTDTATIRVEVLNVNEPPMLGDLVLQVLESTADPLTNPNGTLLTTLMATDEDLVVGDILHYFDNLANPYLTIDEFSGEVRISNPAGFDYELYSLGFAVVSTQVRVEDAGMFIGTGLPLSDTANISFQIINVNERPIVPNQGTFFVTEGATFGTPVATIIAGDPDLLIPVLGETLTFSFANNQGAFSIADVGVINNFTANISVNNGALIDFETQNVYNITVNATDAGLFFPGTPLTGSGIITINVVNANDAPVINDQVFNVSENASMNEIVAQILATDQDILSAGDSIVFTDLVGQPVFAVLADGRIQVIDASALDHETTTSYDLGLVQVNDNGLLIFGSPVLFDTGNITINIIDVKPEITTGLTFSIDEYVVANDNISNGDVVGQITLSEQDLDVPLVAHVFSNASSQDAFDIAADGTITVADRTQLNFESMSEFVFNVSVDDGDDTDTQSITINLNNVNEFNPSVDLNGGNGGVNWSDDFEGDPVFITRHTGGGSVPRAEVSDGDGVIAGMTITITNLEDVGQEFLLFTNPFAYITGSYNTLTGVLDLNGLADPEDYETILDSVRYDNTASSPNTDDRSITVEVEDGDNTAQATATIGFDLMRAANGEVEPSSSVSDLQLLDAQGLLAAAQHYWSAIGVTEWGDITLGISDLSGDALAVSLGDRILVDVNAAGHGWYVDATPYDHSEFSVAVNDTTYAGGGEQMDLLTVLMHELGHTLGLDDGNTDAGIMVSTLDVGMRLLPDDDILNGSDGSVLNFDGLTYDDDASQEGMTLADIDADTVLSGSDDITFEDSQTSYVDDILSPSNSVQDDYSGGAGFTDVYASLQVNDQQAAIV